MHQGFFNFINAKFSFEIVLLAKMDWWVFNVKIITKIITKGFASLLWLMSTALFISSGKFQNDDITMKRWGGGTPIKMW